MLWVIAVSTAVVLLLWLTTYLTIERSTDMAVKRAVNIDLAGLADIYASGGQQELTARIEDRLALVPADGRRAHYLLANNFGERIAGDISAWPRLSARLSEYGAISLPDGTPVQARATQFGDDLRLLVAREYGDEAALLQAVTLVFLCSGAVMVLAAGLAGKIAANRLARRIEGINAAFRDPAGEALNALTIASGDTDEIDELARRSASALGRLRRLIESLHEMSDQIAHEIRTPLMHLDIRLVKALRSDPDKSTAISLVEARADIRRLVDMLESLLDIANSKAHSGDSVGLREVDLSEIVHRLGELYSDSAEESGHEFCCEVEPGISMVGDESQLTRLVTNLLDNAFKYVPSGGSVWLTLRAGPVLTVQDNGPGIPADEREQVFKRFHRVAGQSYENQGIGLGLALAMAIAERHGLKLKLVDIGEGACFVIRKETA